MTTLLDKLLHFGPGIAAGIGFWWLLERYTREAARTMNPLIFLIMVIGGASGLFIFRKMGVPLLSGTFFYIAEASILRVSGGSILPVVIGQPGDWYRHSLTDRLEYGPH